MLPGCSCLLILRVHVCACVYWAYPSAGLDLRDTHKEGFEVTWFNFASCTRDPAVVRTFIGSEGTYSTMLRSCARACTIF